MEAVMRAGAQNIKILNLKENRIIAPLDFFNRQLRSWNEDTLCTVTTLQYLTTTHSYIFWVLTGAQKQRKGNDCSTGLHQQTTDILKWECLKHCYYTPVCDHYPLLHSLSANLLKGQGTKQRKGHDCSIGFLQKTTEIVTWEHLGHCF